MCFSCVFQPFFFNVASLPDERSNPQNLLFSKVFQVFVASYTSSSSVVTPAIYYYPRRALLSSHNVPDRLCTPTSPSTR